MVCRQDLLCKLVAFSAAIARSHALPASDECEAWAPAPLPTSVVLAEPPIVTEVIPVFTETVTTITTTGDCTLTLGCIAGLGCVEQLTYISEPTVCTVTAVATRTTAFACSTATTIVEHTWDPACGCAATRTYYWTPPTSTYPVDCPASTVTVTDGQAAATSTLTVTEARETVTLPGSASTETVTAPFGNATIITVTQPGHTVTSTLPCTNDSVEPGANFTRTVTSVSISTVLSTTTISSGCNPTFTPPSPSSSSGPEPSAGPQACGCSEYGYLVQFEELIQVDIRTGASQSIRDGLTNGEENLNAMGYNILDNYLYAQGTTNKTLYRIGCDGAVELVSIMPRIGTTQLGEVTPDGYYWFSANGIAWVQADLRPGSPTYGQAIAQGETERPGRVADWVYVAGGGEYLYSLVYTSGAGTTLTRFSLATHTWQEQAYYANVQGRWGAMYAVGDGVFCASDNDSGEIWRFPINGGQPRLLAQGPPSDANDGARCVANDL